MDKHVVVIGAGLVGSLLAVCLAKKGYKVEVYERYVDIRSIPSLGRSINLVLTSRGLRAIAAVDKDLADRMLELSVRVIGRGLHVDGQDMFQRYGKDDSEYNNSISRYELNVFLMHAAEKAGVKIMFNHRVESCDFDKNIVHLVTGETQAQPQMIGGGIGQANHTADRAQSKIVDVSFDHLFGCDGGGSAVRYAMRDYGVTTFYEEFINSGYKEMIFPKHPMPGAKPMNPNHLHIWPNHDHFLMTLADRPGTFTGTFYLPVVGDNSFQSLNTDEKVRNFFRKYYKDIFPLMGPNGEDEVVRQFMANPVGRLGSVRCHQFNYSDKVLLLGDAAHGMVPFFGQGTNCGFEDVLVLSKLIDENKGVVDAVVFDKFDKDRRPNSWAMQNMALENFHEMQSRVADPEFLLIKAVENMLENNCPELYRSRYAMVCYGGLGNVTYSAAYRLGVLQEEIRKDLAKGITSPDQLDLEHAKKILRERLLPVQKKMKIDLSTVNHEYWLHDNKPHSKL